MRSLIVLSLLSSLRSKKKEKIIFIFSLYITRASRLNYSSNHCCSPPSAARSSHDQPHRRAFGAPWVYMCGAPPSSLRAHHVVFRLALLARQGLRARFLNFRPAALRRALVFAT